MSNVGWICNSYCAAVLPLPARGIYLIIAGKKKDTLPGRNGLCSNNHKISMVQRTETGFVKILTQKALFFT
jgi:hypothetical protein